MSRWGYDVAIIGAGIVGAACADELSRRGQRVCLVDTDFPGAGATMAAMGHVVVMDDSEAQFALTRYSQGLWQQLRPELPREAEYNPCGTIWIAADEEEMREVVRKNSYYGSRGITTRVLNSQELRTCEPGLRAGLAGGLLVPGDVVVHPPSATKCFIERALKRGADSRIGTVVRIGDHTIELATGQQITAHVIVNAAGSNAADLTPGVDIRKRKGHLAITDQRPGFLSHQLVELGYLKSAHTVASDSVAFNVQPRPGGQILVGSSRQYGSETGEVEDQILARMLRRAQEYMPGLAEMTIVRTWTGLRAATQDKLPLIGPWPQDESVFLATGHEGLGITTSLGTAQLIADQITGATSPIPVEPYLPSRNLKEPSHAG